VTRRALTLSLALSACGGQPVTRGLEEPLRVPGAQFIEGTLPGLAPLTIEEIQAGVEEQTPRVPAADFGGGSTVKLGESGKRVTGSVSADAAAIAVGFAALGSGYWVQPVRAFDAQTGGFSFGFTLELSTELEPGLQRLLFAAVGPSGQSGNQKALDLCLEPEIPDKPLGTAPAVRGNACDPSFQPPALVVSLGWDSAVDLDLQIVTPSGKRVDAKHVTTAEAMPGEKPDWKEQGTGILDRDSNAGCVIDGLNRENLVFAELPPPGVYGLYVDLYEACGKPAVHFTASLTQRVDGPEPDTFAQAETFRQDGQLAAAQADGGARIGLFVTEFTVQ
jgi:hypothetical protein